MLKFKKLIGYCIAAASVGITGFVSALMVNTNTPFYLQLQLPKFMPPPIAFSVAWGFVYVCFVVLLGEVVCCPQLRQRAWMTVTVLILNSVWCGVFFGLHLIYASLAVLATELAFLVYQTISLAKSARREWTLLIPINIWYVFLFALNYGSALTAQ